MMCDERLFAPQVYALSDCAEIWVGDVTRSSTMAGIAGDVLRDCPFDTFALAGLSLGGIVAMDMVRQAPERIDRLALLDTNHRAETKDRRADRAPQIARARNGGLTEVLAREMKPNYLAPTNRDDQEIRGIVLAMGLSLGPGVFERQSLALRDRPDYADVLAAYRRHTLVLCGRHDALCPPKRHKEIAALLGDSTLVVVEDAGHLPTLEASRPVTLCLQRWLEA